MEDEKKEEGLSVETVWFMIAAAIFFDLLQFLFTFIFMGWLVGIFAGLTFFFWFRSHGIKFNKASRWGSFAFTYLIEVIPFLSAIPAWTAEVSYLALTNKLQEIVPGAGMTTLGIAGMAFSRKRENTPSPEPRSQSTLIQEKMRGRIPLQSSKYAPGTPRNLDKPGNTFSDITPPVNLVSKNTPLTSSLKNGQGGTIQLDPNKETFSFEREIKSEETKRIAQLSWEWIAESNKKMGIPLRNLSLERITYSSDEGGGYYGDSDTITTGSGLDVVTHELLHYASHTDHDSLGSIPKARTSKTGFSSHWDKEGDRKTKNFSALNEAVTQKLTLEILKEKSQDIINGNLNLEEETRKKLESKRSILLGKLNDHLQRIDTQPNEVYRDLWEAMDDSEEDRAAFASAVSKRRKTVARSVEKLQIMNIGKINQETLKERYPDVYKDEMRILDKLLEKTAQERSVKENLSYDEALKLEWDDLKRAYFAGNTMYLKKFEAATGKGTLRRLNDIDRDKVRRKEESPEDFKKKVDDMINRI